MNTIKALFVFLTFFCLFPIESKASVKFNKFYLGMTKKELKKVIVNGDYSIIPKYYSKDKEINSIEIYLKENRSDALFKATFFFHAQNDKLFCIILHSKKNNNNIHAKMISGLKKMYGDPIEHTPNYNRWEYAGGNYTITSIRSCDYSAYPFTIFMENNIMKDHIRILEEDGRNFSFGLR